MRHPIVKAIDDIVSRPISKGGRGGRAFDFIVDPFCGTGMLIVEALGDQLARIAIATDADRAFISIAETAAHVNGIHCTRAEFLREGPSQVMPKSGSAVFVANLRNEHDHETIPDFFRLLCRCAAPGDAVIMVEPSERLTSLMVHGRIVGKKKFFAMKKLAA